MQEDGFTKEALFEYRGKAKYRSGLILILSLSTIIVFAILFTVIQWTGTGDLSTILPPPLVLLFHQFTDEIYSGRPLGIFLLAFTGGLFFLFLPVDLIFLNFLRSGVDPFLLSGVYLLALIMAHSLNYLIGARLSSLSKKLIPPKKFYTMKGLLNHYGPVVIFVVNALPLPSPMLSAILGTFRYNLFRFYLLFIPGQAVLYGSILLLHTFILKHWKEIF